MSYFSFPSLLWKLEASELMFKLFSVDGMALMVCPSTGQHWQGPLPFSREVCAALLLPKSLHIQLLLSVSHWAP